MKHPRVLALTSVVVGATTALFAGCLSNPDASEVGSSAASPIVQQGGVARFRAHAEGNVTRVELLDEVGAPIGALALTTEGSTQVHAQVWFGGHALDARWTATEVTFTRDGMPPVTFDAASAGRPELAETLLSATGALNVATGVAHDLGVFSPLQREPTPATPLFELGSGATGCPNGANNCFDGSDWEWGTSQSATQAAWAASRRTAESSCQSIYPGCIVGYSNSVTRCTTGTITVTCTTTVSY